MNALIRNGLLSAGIGLSALAHAATVTLSGDITFHNDVVQLEFTLAAPAANLKIWSDSWQSGTNFDPTAALWSFDGADFSLLAQVDDDDSIDPAQGFYDTGFSLSPLAAGRYRVTLAAALNAANGTLLSQGFQYDGETPIRLVDWNQPTYDPNANDQKGGFWRLTFSGVDAVNVVPEPASWGLAALAFAALAASSLGRRRRP